MGSIKILPQLGDRDVKVQVSILMEDACDEVNDKTIGRVLICRQLYFHCSELHPPSDVIIDGYFQPDRVPVGSIEHFEEDVFLLRHFFELSMHNQKVSLEDVSNMEG